MTPPTSHPSPLGGGDHTGQESRQERQKRERGACSNRPVEWGFEARNNRPPKSSSFRPLESSGLGPIECRSDRVGQAAVKLRRTGVQGTSCPYRYRLL